MGTHEQKLILTCDICHGKKLLPIGTKDFVECPQCYGTGKIEVLEMIKTPPRIFNYGTLLAR